MVNVSEKKTEYVAKLLEYLQTYKRCCTVHADNVTSKQLQKVRVDLRGKAVVLFGKNTMIRRAFRQFAVEHEELAFLEKFVPLIKGNLGFVFTNAEFSEILDVLKDNEVGAPARAGAIAPVAVTIPAGPTGLEPSQTSFFQTLNIPTKIVKGAIEMQQAVEIFKVGDKVTASQAALLVKMNIRPFSYRLVMKHLIDNGSVFPADVLDISEDDILSSFTAGVANISAIGLALNFPVISAVPHMFINAFKNVLSIGLATEYSFDAVEKVKAALAAGPAVAAAPAAGEAAPAAAVEEEEEEEEEGADFDLFD